MDFSVLICVYNKDNVNYFIEACDSVINQTLSPSEVVLVVDGPVGSKLRKSIIQIEQKIQGLGISFKSIWMKKNKGHGVARQTGLEQCAHDLVALVDADDINYPDRFKLQIDYFTLKPETSVLGAQIREINHASKKALALKEVPNNSKELYDYLKSRCPFNQMSVMFRKADVLNAGGYVDFFHNEDYNLWIRMRINRCIFANLPIVLVDARVDESFYERRGGLQYFLSEFRIQKYMVRSRVISIGRYIINTSIRFVVQVIVPSKIREKVFQSFFRGKP